MFATQDVRLTGIYEDMYPGGFPDFLEGQDDRDLLDLGRLPGGEAEVENALQLLSRSWT